MTQKSPYLLLFSYSKLEYYKFKLEFRVAVLEAFVVVGAFPADELRAGACGNQNRLANMRLLHAYGNRDLF